MTKPSLLLINPWINDFASFDLWAKPLGLLRLAALLRLEGYGIDFVDCLDNHYPGLDSEPGLKPAVPRQFGTGKYFRQKIAKPACFKDIPRHYYRHGLSPRLFVEAISRVQRPTAILVTSGMTYWYPGVFEAIRLAKDTWPGVPAILGGIYATLCHDHARRFSGADIVVRGPGEEKVFELLDGITGIKRSLSLPPGPDDFPYPAFDLLSRTGYVCLQTSTGCPYRCSYCASHLLAPEFSSRDPGKVVEEIVFWDRRHGVKDFAFYDDALLFNPEEGIVPILKGVIASGVEVNFHSPNGLHASFIDARLAHLLHRAGFRDIHLGLETVSRRLDAKTTFEEFAGAVRCLKESGFHTRQIVAYLLMGLPGQDRSEVEAAVHAIKGLGVTPYLSEYSPIPGTELWNEAVACSRYDLEGEPLTHNNTALPCLSENLTWEDANRLKLLARA